MSNYHHHSPGLQALADELVQNLARKTGKAKLEQIKRKKAAERAGVFPGMGRKTSPFKDKKKEGSRKACRKPKKDE